MAAFKTLYQFRRILPSHLPARTNHMLRYISSSHHFNGLEEFFPAGVYESGGPGPKEVKTGRRWHASDLRQKSNNDLHKLWYVLLKEMNMLQTVKAEAKRLQMPMPNPERIKKVQKSMAMIKVVIGERERAVQKLAEMGYKPQCQEESQETDCTEEKNDSQKSMNRIPDEIHLNVNSENGNDSVDKNKTLMT